MGGVFSKKNTSPKQPEVSQQDQAILQLKTQRDKIKQMLKRKEKCIEKERLVAKQLLSEGKKDRALLLLKKKRYQENIIEQTLQSLNKIEQMVQDLEFAEIQQRVLDGLKQGNDALKKMNSLFDVEEIERIMDETKEAAEYQQEINELISGKLDSSDLADVEQELEELLAAQEPSKLPDVPTHELPEAQKEEQRQKTKEKREKVALEA